MALSPGKEAPVPTVRRLGRPQTRSGRHGKEKYFDPTGTQTPTPWPSSPYPVAVQTTRVTQWIIGNVLDEPTASIFVVESYHKMVTVSLKSL
jgi:hypothetical protein